MGGASHRKNARTVQKIKKKKKAFEETQEYDHLGSRSIARILRNKEGNPVSCTVCLQVDMSSQNHPA